MSPITLLRCAFTLLTAGICGTPEVERIGRHDYQAFLAVAPVAGTAVARAAAPRPTGAIIRIGSDGLFHIAARANNQPIRFTVDTGASIIVLNARDARAVGLQPARGTRSNLRTASGATGMRLHRLRRLSVAGMDLYDVDVAVVENGGPHTSLLGLNVLTSFGQVAIRGQELHIVP